MPADLFVCHLIALALVSAVPFGCLVQLPVAPSVCLFWGFSRRCFFAPLVWLDTSGAATFGRRLGLLLLALVVLRSLLACVIVLCCSVRGVSGVCGVGLCSLSCVVVCVVCCVSVSLCWAEGSRQLFLRFSSASDCRLRFLLPFLFA